MAKTFRQRVAQAEAAARAEELRLQQEVWDAHFLLLCNLISCLPPYLIFNVLISDSIVLVRFCWLTNFSAVHQGGFGVADDFSTADNSLGLDELNVDLNLDEVPAL